MKISKYGYYGDFFVYPVLIASLPIAVKFEVKNFQTYKWLLFCASGFAIWTLAEYFLHRSVFHHFSFIKKLHDAHHADPTALIGSPTWLTVSIGSIIVFFPLFLAFGLMSSSAITTGLMIGYLCYVTVHHLNHHYKPRHGTYLYWTKRRHALHHYCGETKNFGIITNIWDRLLGTEQFRQSEKLKIGEAHGTDGFEPIHSKKSD